MKKLILQVKLVDDKSIIIRTKRPRVKPVKRPRVKPVKRPLFTN